MLDHPIFGILGPGLIGGFVLALLIFRLQRRTSTEVSADPFARNGNSSDVINMAHIRVAGIGGLGLVAMAVAVALNVPRIGQTLAIGAVAGIVLAAFLVVRRRKSGVLSSSSAHPGANTVLKIRHDKFVL